VYNRLAAVTVLGVGLLLPLQASAQEWETSNTSRRVAGEKVLRVDLEYGAGTLALGPGPSGTLYRTNLRYDARSFKPVVDYADSRLRVGLSGSTGRGRNVRSGELDLRLSPDVPMDLQLKFGAAEAELQLGGIRVRRLDVQTGASKTTLNISEPNLERCQSAQFTVGAARFEASGLGNLNAEQLTVQGGVGEMVLDFTGAWPADLNGKVDMGLGSLTLRVPRRIGLRIVRGGVLSSFDSEGLTKRGNTYYSENWEQSGRKLSLDLNAALGSIRVVWLDS
jgi:hypothetical protein